MKKIFIQFAVAASCIFLATPAQIHAQEIKSKDYYDNIYLTYQEDSLIAKDNSNNFCFTTQITKDVIYTNATEVNLRTDPSIDSTIVNTLNYRTPLVRLATTNIGWDIIIYNESICYIWNEYVTTTITPTNNDIRLMSAIIFSEAGNQCLAGKQAVGIVIMNRVKSDKFPNNINDVIYQTGQFSPARNGSLKRSLALYDTNQLPRECVDAAIYALNNNTIISYNNTLYDISDFLFFSQYVSNCRLQIQDHMFK